MKLTIGDRDYTLRFSVEASLCEECVSKVTDFMVLSYQASDSDDLRKSVSESISNVSTTALAALYGGLLENHSDEIKSMTDARNLAKTYLLENQDNEKGNWFSLLNTLIEAMDEDGFFKLIGLEELMERASQTEDEQPKPAKKVSSKVTRK